MQLIRKIWSFDRILHNTELLHSENKKREVLCSALVMLISCRMNSRSTDYSFTNYYTETLLQKRRQDVLGKKWTNLYEWFRTRLDSVKRTYITVFYGSSIISCNVTESHLQSLKGFKQQQPERQELKLLHNRNSLNVTFFPQRFVWYRIYL